MRIFQFVLTGSLALISSFGLSGCTTAPESDPAYVSSMQYQGYNCKQISAEMDRVSKKIDQETQNDSTNQILGAAVTALAISKGYSMYGDDRSNVELKRLKNQYSVLEQTSIQKECGL